VVTTVSNAFMASASSCSAAAISSGEGLGTTPAIAASILARSSGSRATAGQSGVALLPEPPARMHISQPVLVDCAEVGHYRLPGLSLSPLRFHQHGDEGNPAGFPHGDSSASEPLGSLPSDEHGKAPKCAGGQHSCPGWLIGRHRPQQAAAEAGRPKSSGRADFSRASVIAVSPRSEASEAVGETPLARGRMGKVCQNASLPSLAASLVGSCRPIPR
jgi:hypothetical protein